MDQNAIVEQTLVKIGAILVFLNHPNVGMSVFVRIRVRVRVKAMATVRVMIRVRVFTFRGAFVRESENSFDLHAS